ncbi:hypothetical protein SAMN05216198_0471 [Halopseudomonas litoralis]|uniref:Uncharacterized protein n=2 Tax=Halopseudomonas litoralis TaxID=797277 RepID=A0A1H1M1H2_9GAMM|nr:hypothetical protein SAMN05216198_0471 [Halopseudomonas litoralis]
MNSDYASTAYSPEKLQRQSVAKPRSALARMTSRRLPWGNTQEIVPDIFMTPDPDALRGVELGKKEKEEKLAKGTYRPAPMEHIDFHDRCDHEHYRHAPWAARAQFWVYLISFGKDGFFLFLVLGGWVAFLDGARSSRSFFTSFWEYFMIALKLFLLPCGRDCQIFCVRAVNGLPSGRPSLTRSAW